MLTYSYAIVILFTSADSFFFAQFFTNISMRSAAEIDVVPKCLSILSALLNSATVNLFL